MSSAEITQVRANPSLYAKDYVNVPWLLHTLDIADEYNALKQTGTKRQAAAKRRELLDARVFLQRGKVPPLPQPQPNLEPAVNPWITWWNSMPSIWPSVYGWMAKRHNWFMLPQLLVR